MSAQAIRYRRTMPTRQELREQIENREIAQELRAGLQSWADYLIETGRAYQ